MAEGKSDVEQILELLLHNEKGQKFLPLFLSHVPDPASRISHPAPELQQHIEKLSMLLPHFKHPMCSVLTDHLNHNGHLAGGNYMQVRHFGLFIKGLKPNGFFPNGGKKVQEKGEELPKILKDEEDPVVKLKLKLAYLTAQLENQKNGDGAAKVIAEHRKKMLRIVAGLCLGSFIIYKVLLQGSVGRNAGDMLYGAKNYEINPEVVSVTFNDVKGCDEAKEELEDIVDFLKNGERFLKMGAKLPKGLLLVGSPGTGKTLLAKAIAGEAGVPFFHASGSEFDEVFVGQGSKRVRNLFENAKKRAPCIIFIDEIDSVGGKRTSTGITPYANQTVNQLLSEMDGFDSQESIIVIGATNKKGNLDSALLRPGRFDMEVHVRPPDNDGRKELFRLYLSKCKHDGKINIDSLAKQTIGMTGADIANLVNQAAIIATLKGGSHVTMDDLAEARDKVTMGPAWKNKKIDEEELWRTAYHEAGHTIVAYFTDHALPLHKVTIEPRGEALGVTMSVPDKEPYGMTRAQCLARMDVGMGGRAGEELKYGVEFVGNGKGCVDL
ncbi:ATP-dependent zinc metalloprotease YME1L-like, partial [Dreissena polymorpha]|uniref:ATP-dependent zinc metalloprotease YME1L-like n=1 Tax=Dreissena polymorpha TaxID=45954 RepID=UPI0022644C5E